MKLCKITKEKSMTKGYEWSSCEGWMGGKEIMNLYLINLVICVYDVNNE
jgi:hypothetical protein